MRPTFTWLDLTADDSTRMRRIIDLFSENGTIDELGLGTLRDGLSNALFPGTSSIQTRLRYVFFVPWIYQDLRTRRRSGSSIAEHARVKELALIDPLSRAVDPEGVIGSRARNSLKRLPSAVYWSALCRWQIFAPNRSQSWYHAQFERFIRARSRTKETDDPGIVWTQQPDWHLRLPRAPDELFDTPTFDLTRAEAEFIQGRWTTSCSGTLLAWLATHGEVEMADWAWDDPAIAHVPGPIQEVVELARRFSLQMEGAPLFYNLALAHRRHAMAGQDDSELIEDLRESIALWLDRQTAEAPLDCDRLWHFCAENGVTMRVPQKRFVDGWTARLSALSAVDAVDDSGLRALVASREKSLKGTRSRFLNTGRLLSWTGHAGEGRMGFRWSRVRQLVADLQTGLAR